MLRPRRHGSGGRPVYPGLKNLLPELAPSLSAFRWARMGIDIAQLERVLEREQPRFLVVTSNFQTPHGRNSAPGGATRIAWKRRARRGYRWWKTTPMANCATKASRCRPSSNWMSTAAPSYSAAFPKVSFPGLRVGWVVGPKPLIDRLRQAKEAADLHTDQLSQAVLLEFAESGRLEAHRARRAPSRRRAAGRDPGRFAAGFCRPTRGGRGPRRNERVGCGCPEPAGWQASLRAAGAEGRRGPICPAANYSRISRLEPGALRLSFAGPHSGPDPERPVDFGTNCFGARSKAPPGASSPPVRWCDRAANVRERYFTEVEMFDFSSEPVSIEGRSWPKCSRVAVIMDVTNAEQAKIAEDAGASRRDGAGARAADIRKEDGVGAHGHTMRHHGKRSCLARFHTSPSWPRPRIGHFMEARILERAGRGLHRRERKMLTPADEEHHIAKSDFQSSVRVRRPQPG